MSILLVWLFAAAAHTTGLSESTRAPLLLEGDLQPVGPAVLLNAITGPNAVVSTTGTANVWGNDLGIPLLHQQGMWLLFGDTFGYGSNFTAHDGKRTAWRSQTLALAEVVRQTASDVQLAAMDWHHRAGDMSASQLISAGHDMTFKGELTVIPTAAWSNGSHAHVWYMSVRQFDGDSWSCNNASVATATGNLTTASFLKHDSTVAWQPSPNSTVDTLQFAVAQYNTGAKPSPVRTGKCQLDPNYVYMFGTPCGRHGSASVLRVKSNQALHRTEYEYFAGTAIENGNHKVMWAQSQSDSVQVLPPGVGELSITWVPQLYRWLALYTAPATSPSCAHSNGACCIVARLSACLWSGWSKEELVLATAPDGGVIYGGFSHPHLVDGNLRDVIYATVSLHTQYNVHLARLNLTQIFGTAAMDIRPH